MIRPTRKVKKGGDNDLLEALVTPRTGVGVVRTTSSLLLPNEVTSCEVASDEVCRGASSSKVVFIVGMLFSDVSDTMVVAFEAFPGIFTAMEATLEGTTRLGVTMPTS